MKKTLFILLLTIIAGTTYAQQCAYSYSAPSTTATFTHGWPIIGTQNVDSVRFDYGDGSPSVLFTSPVPFNSNHTYPGGGWYNTCLTRYISDLSQPNVVITCNYCDSVFIPGPPAPCNASLSLTGGANFISSTGSATGGATPYTFYYTLNPGNITNSTGAFNSLNAGWYQVCLTAVDANQDTCSIACDSVQVGNTQGPCNASLSLTGGANFISSMGSAIGGATPYTFYYTLNPGNITNGTGTFNSLTAGWYQVCLTAVDANQDTCSIACDSVQVGNTQGPCTTTLSTSVTGNTINAVGTSTGGIGGYSHSYTVNPGSFANNTGSFPGMASGWYQVCVTGYDSLQNPCTTVCDSVFVSPNQPGGCIATANYSVSISGLTATFTNSSTCTGCAAPMTYYWDFGDGSNSTLANPTHNYLNPNSYVICLTVNGFDSLQSPCSDSLCDTYMVGASAVNDFTLNALNIYPNPTNGNFTIEVPAGEKAEKIIISDVTGRKIISLKYANSLDSKLIFDLKNNAEGIYFIKLQTNRQLYTSTILNQE